MGQGNQASTLEAMSRDPFNLPGVKHLAIHMIFHPLWGGGRRTHYLFWGVGKQRDDRMNDCSTGEQSLTAAASLLYKFKQRMLLF